MAQNLPAAVDTEIAAEQSRPVLLFELYLTAGTLRYSATNVDIIFPTGGGGNTYYAKAVGMGNIKSSAEGQIETMVFQFDNISQDMWAYNVAESFDGKQIIVKKVYRDALGDSTYYRELFSGYMGEPNQIDKEWLTFEATSGNKLQRRLLQKFFQKECNNTFGDSACNADGLADLTSLIASGTAESGTTITLVDSALTQADAYWQFGVINIGISGTTYRRFVESFVAATDKITFDVPLPSGVTGTSTYTVYKGCPLTVNACEANGAYGPSADNSANFDGFIHIGDTPND